MSRRSKSDDPATLLLRGPLTLVLVILAMAAGAVLGPRIPVEPSDRVATSEKMLPPRLKSFLEEHSWLDYTTRGGETLPELAKTLRVGTASRLRSENPALAEIADDQTLEAGLVLRIRYNVDVSQGADDLLSAPQEE